MAKVEFDLNGGCWLWSGARMFGTGYGTFQPIKRSAGGSTETTHRASYKLFRGEIPKGMQVLHKCDVRACCNPDHLFLGTHKDNMADMAAKGRAASLRGSAAYAAKLTEAQVWEALARLEEGETCRQIGDRFGVDQCAINAIRRGISWGVLTGIPKPSGPIARTK